ncbi:leucine-rich repeat-containing protein 2 isoform X4 [Macaca mulatta]
MRILDLPKNQISYLPAEIGCLKNLKELNVSFNHLKSIPPELGDCENLDRLDCSGNLELMELPFELSNLKQVTFVDISANKFSSVPICVLRMSNLQWLDISNNNLIDLPQDIDRLEELQSFLLYKNKLTYLPYSMLNLKKLTLLVVSGDHLVELPTALCDSSTPLKFVSLRDNPIDNARCEDGDEIMESERDRQHFDKEVMKAYIEDLKERETVCPLPKSQRGSSMNTHEETDCKWVKWKTSFSFPSCSWPNGMQRAQQCSVQMWQAHSPSSPSFTSHSCAETPPWVRKQGKEPDDPVNQRRDKEVS